MRAPIQPMQFNMPRLKKQALTPVLFSVITIAMALKRLLAGVLTLSLAACSLPSLTNSPIKTAIPRPTATSAISPTPAPSPTETPSPTTTPQVRIQEADQEFFDGNYPLAQAEYQIALSNSTDPAIQAAALWGLGRVEYAAGNNGKALTDLQNLANTFPGTLNGIRAYFLIGQIDMALERYPEAVQAFSVYLALRPNILDSYVQELRGDAYAAAQNYTEAIKAYQASEAASHLGSNTSLEIKLAQAYENSGDSTTALTKFDEIANATTNDYIKAQMDLLSGQAYLSLGEADKAYQYFQHTVENYPLAYDSYTALVALVNAGVPVDDLNRGLVDYYAGQYGYALDAFQRYKTAGLDKTGTATYYHALTQIKLGNYQVAVDELTAFIASYPDNENWHAAWGEKADTQWAQLDQYNEAAQTLLDYAARVADPMFAPQALLDAGHIYERAGQLDAAAKTWTSLADTYPGSNLAPEALFQAGIVRIRNNESDKALLLLQRDLLLASSTQDQARAAFWVGKVEQSLGKADAAKSSWQQAASFDSTDYYSLRAEDLLLGRPTFQPALSTNLQVDLATERKDAEAWLRVTFNLPSDTDLSQPGSLLGDPRLIRGTELWEMGYQDDARLEFEDLRTSIQDDPAQTYRLTNYLLNLGLYRPAIFAARQVLTLAGEVSQSQTLAAPKFFNHVRYGLYYSDIVLPTAQQDGFDPLFLYSVIRQESLFEGFVRSTAGARGLMQIMPSTGQEIANNLGWPPDFTPDDLYRPSVSITMGAGYLQGSLIRLNGDLYGALASYNAGSASEAAWRSLSGSDPDLFLEVIRFSETSDYIRSIYENYSMYKLLYGYSP